LVYFIRAEAHTCIHIMFVFIRSDLAAFLYPTYASFKSLKTANSEDDTLWLTYWVVFGFFHVAESFFGFMLRIFPFYHVSKLLFLLWCYMPQTQGSVWLFKHFISGLMTRYEKRIDAQLVALQKEEEVIMAKVMPFVEDVSARVTQQVVSAAVTSMAESRANAAAATNSANSQPAAAPSQP